MSGGLYSGTHPYEGHPRVKATSESLTHAVNRMRSQGFSDKQITAQVRKWHPAWDSDAVASHLVANVKTGASLEQVASASKTLGLNPHHSVLGDVTHVATGAYDIGKTLGKAVVQPAYEDIRHGPNSRQAHAARENQMAVGTAVGKSLVHPFTDLPSAIASGDPGRVGSDLGNIGLNFAPVGKAAGILGGLRAAKKLKEAGDTAKELDVAKGVKPLNEALSGKSAFKGMGPNEKIGAQLDDPNLGKSVTQLRREQDKLYSQERAKRVARAEDVMNRVGGEEGNRLALKELSGELPKLEFNAGKELDRSTIPDLFQHVQNHPDLRPYERVRTRNALLKVFDGKTPQSSEIKLLVKVFGEHDAKSLAGSVSLWKHFHGTAWELVNVPRALMSTLDVSAVMRQNLVASLTHPIISGRNIGPMFKALKSENGYRAIEDYIVTHPKYDQAVKDGLAVTDFEGGLGTREEAWFGANLAEKLTGGTRSPVRMSGRAYVGFLNKTRIDIYNNLIDHAEQIGLNTKDGKTGKEIAKAVNSATGRGTGPQAIHSWLPALNSLFFSPRLLFSRLDYLNPVNYTRLNPVARREYLKGALGLVGVLGTVLAMAKMAGAKVGVDPRNADFAKIRLGNTRIDILGGFQQPIRLLAQLSSGKVVSSTSGKTLTLGPQGPGKLSKYDIAQRFVQGKLAPVPGLIVDYSKGVNFIGQPFSWKQEAAGHLSPLVAQDVYDLYRQEGPAAAAGGYGLAAIGIGVQTYGNKKKKPKGSSSSGNSSPGLYGGDGSSSSPSSGLYGDGGSSSSSGGGLYSQSP